MKVEMTPKEIAKQLKNACLDVIYEGDDTVAAEGTPEQWAVLLAPSCPRCAKLQEALKKAPECAVVLANDYYNGHPDAPVTPQGMAHGIEKLLRALVKSTLPVLLCDKGIRAELRDECLEIERNGVDPADEIPELSADEKALFDSVVRFATSVPLCPDCATLRGQVEWLTHLESENEALIRQSQHTLNRMLGLGADNKALRAENERFQELYNTCLVDRIKETKALRTQAEQYRDALELAAVRLEILTGRARACHAETGRHELMDEAEMFCQEVRAALTAHDAGKGEG